jgi:hypothetical protein
MNSWLKEIKKSWIWKSLDWFGFNTIDSDDLKMVIRRHAF